MYVDITEYILILYVLVYVEYILKDYMLNRYFIFWKGIKTS